MPFGVPETGDISWRGRMDSPDDDLAADEGLVQKLGVIRIGWRVLVSP